MPTTNENTQTPQWPATNSVWHIQNWVQNKVVRTYADLDDAKAVAEHLIRQQLNGFDGTIDWRNGCCDGEGCDACFSSSRHRPPLYIDACLTDPDTGLKVADYRLVEVVVYEEPDTDQLPGPGA